MTPEQIFKDLTELDFIRPTKHPQLDMQKRSLDKLIACGLAAQVGQNKYSLTTEGRKASVIGLEKWAKSLNDICL